MPFFNEEQLWQIFFFIGECVTSVINSSKSSDSKFFDLGYRELQPNPWETISTRLKIGQKLDGQVIDIVQFGAFIDIGQGISSLLHNSELSWVDRDIKAAKLFRIGDKVSVVVKTIEPDSMKIGVSYRDGQPNPWDFLESTGKGVTQEKGSGLNTVRLNNSST